MLQIYTAWGDIICDTWNRNLLTIHFLDNSLLWTYNSMEVSYNPPFFLFREICTYNNFCFIICFLFFLILCFLNFVFGIYIVWFLCSNKTWLSQRFSLLNRYELVLLEHFLFCFHVFRFLSNYQFNSHYHHYDYDRFHYYCCCYYLAWSKSLKV